MPQCALHSVPNTGPCRGFLDAAMHESAQPAERKIQTETKANQESAVVDGEGRREAGEEEAERLGCCKLTAKPSDSARIARIVPSPLFGLQGAPAPPSSIAAARSSPQRRRQKLRQLAQRQPSRRKRQPRQMHFARRNGRRRPIGVAFAHCQVHLYLSMCYLRSLQHQFDPLGSQSRPAARVDYFAVGSRPLLQYHRKSCLRQRLKDLRNQKWRPTLPLDSGYRHWQHQPESPKQELAGLVEEEWGVQELCELLQLLHRYPRSLL